MTVEKKTRRRAVILSADIKDDSRLLGGDETETLKVLSAHTDVITSLIGQHHGRLLDSPGDNILAEFAKAFDAVQAAVAIQKTLKARNAQLSENRRLAYHIGINLGDVIADSKQLYGDNVDIATRLESLAEPGGICVSKTVYDQIPDKSPFTFEYLGEKSFENTSKTVETFSVAGQTAGALDKETSPAISEPLDKLTQIEEMFIQAQMKRRKRVRARFKRRLRNYLIFNAILFFINMMTYRGFWWFIWPALGWGLFILMGWKRTAYSTSDKMAGPENKSLLPIARTAASGPKATFLKIRLEQTDDADETAETVAVKVPLEALKAGVKLDMFLPFHARQIVNEVLREKGLNLDPASQDGKKGDVVYDLLAGLDIVVVKDGEKISISCE